MLKTSSISGRSIAPGRIRRGFKNAGGTLFRKKKIVPPPPPPSNVPENPKVSANAPRRINRTGKGKAVRLLSPAAIELVAGRPPINTNSNKIYMGFLRKIGRAVGSIATSIIPGQLDDALFNQLLPAKRKTISRSALTRNPNMQGGVPPTAFPDFPGIPDFGDIEQLLRGRNPMESGGIFNDATNNFTRSNGLESSVAELFGSNQIVMEPGQKVIAKAPPGYVIVDMPDGTKKAVLKSVARKLGLWKSRPKPPISASEWKKLKSVDRTRKKAKKIAQTADFKCTKK